MGVMNSWILLALPVLIYLMYKIVRGYPIYIPLPRKTIIKIFDLASVCPKDLVYDLGSGDGRALIIASRDFGARAVGIEKNFFLAKFSAWRIKKLKLEDKVKVINKNFFDCDLSDASVVLVYLTQKINDLLEPKLKKELRKGTRVVSASHKFKGLKPVKKIKTGHFFSYLYII